VKGLIRSHRAARRTRTLQMRDGGWHKAQSLV
jgi:hypothetical protein